MKVLSKGEKLAKNTLILTIGKLSTQAITFFLLPLYTHYLTTEEYGAVDLMTTIVSFLLPIITLQIEQGVFRFLIDFRSERKKQASLISNTLLFIIFQSLLFSIIFLIASPFIKNSYKWFLLLNSISCIFSSVMLQIARGLGHNAKYAVASIIISITTIISNMLLIAVFKLGAYGMLIGTLVGHILGVIYIFFSEKISQSFKLKLFDKKEVSRLLKYSFPLVPTMVSWWIVNVSDRMLINGFIGMGANGIYSVANKFSSILTMVYGIFNLSWTESASLSIESADAEVYINNIYNKIVRMLGGASACIISVMPLVFGILVESDYFESFFQIPILIIAAMFCNLSSFEGAIYIARKKSKEVAKSTIIAAFVNIGVNLLLINIIGIYAASISSLIAYLFIFIFRIIDLRNIVKLRLSFKNAAIVVGILALSTTTYYVGDRPTIVISLIAILIISIYINRDTIKGLLKMVTRKKAQKPKRQKIDN